MAIENSTRRTGQNEGQRAGSFYPANTLSGSRFTESDSDDDSSDTSSVLTQIGNDEFPSHFIEREGRLFHSHGSLPYPLPVDGEEQARLNSQHKILRDLLGSHADGPVARVLASEPRRQKRVLDLGSGTGVWVMDMARIYTDVRFSGIDIVPIAPRTGVPSNVDFEIGDITQTLRWRDETMDFVHARNISLGVSDYPQILQEAARVLRRGGLFVSAEICRQVDFAPGFPGRPDVDAPRADMFYNVINDVLVRRGIHDYTRSIPAYVRDSGRFSDGRVMDYMIPIGTSQVPDRRRMRLGLNNLEVMTEFARSVGPMLRDEGYSNGFVEELITGFMEDMRIVPGMVVMYQTVWMIKA